MLSHKSGLGSQSGALNSLGLPTHYIINEGSPSFSVFILTRNCHHLDQLPCRKNFTKGYSEIQVQVREATSNEIYGPTMTQLEEIARASYNPYHKNHYLTVQFII